MRKFVRAYGMDRNCDSPSECDSLSIVEIEVINDDYAYAYRQAKEMIEKIGDIVYDSDIVYDYEEITRE